MTMGGKNNRKLLFQNKFAKVVYRFKTRKRECFPLCVRGFVEAVQISGTVLSGKDVVVLLLLIIL
jgi:hypothetical protein